MLDAFLPVWRQGACFQARRVKASTWLLAITHHKAVDAVRREQLRRTEPEGRIGQIADDSVDLYRDACRSVQRDEIRRALSLLLAKQCEVIELAYLQGYSQREVARRLGQPLGMIKSRTHAALTQVRAHLDGVAIAVCTAG